MNPVEVALNVGFLILSLGIHEAAHAWVALKCGDTTARDEGRLTLNPIAHIDPVMTILLPLGMFIMSNGAMMFGGARPVPVVTRNLRHPLRDMMFVALAGPFSNLLLAIFFMTIWKVVGTTAGFGPEVLAMRVLSMAVRFNLLLAAFNMIPIPPLDGSRVMAYLLPYSLRESYVRLERFGMILVFALIFYGPLSGYLFQLIGYMPRGIDGVRYAQPSLVNLVDFMTGGRW